MKIAIMGAGAMGSMYGGPLCEKNDVWFLDIWKEHIDVINQKGLTVRISDSEERIYHPHAVVSPEEIGEAELVIIFVKSIHTAEAMKENQALFGPKTMALTLQNGSGNDEDIQPYIKEENLFIGTTACGATMLGPGEVFQAGKGITKIGVNRQGDLARAQKIVDILNESGFEAQISETVMEAVWTKLLVNVGLNAPLALLGVRNGFIAESPHALAVGRALIQEGAAVAAAEGYPVDGEEIVDHYYLHSKVGMNRCSMLQDVDKKRKTEITKMNGAIVRLGKKHGIATPYNEVLEKLIEAKEDSYSFL